MTFFLYLLLLILVTNHLLSCCTFLLALVHKVPRKIILSFKILQSFALLILHLIYKPPLKFPR